MANKYQVEKIRRIIVERLESDWPQSLTDWRRLEAEIEVMESGAWALAEDPQTIILTCRPPSPRACLSHSPRA